MSAYTGQRVCIIGGMGFLGANLVARLLAEGARPTVLTPLRERHAEQAERFERGGARIIEGDLRDRELMPGLVDGQDLVINLSGQSGAVRSMEDPWPDLDINLRGNLVLLEALRASNPRAKLVFAGSRLQYGKPAGVPVPEDAVSDPLCLHAIHKRTVEEYLKLYAHLFGLRYAIARITNPYGPGQPTGRTAYGVINRLIHLALADGTLTIYGDGRQLRDYIYVDDVTSALLAIGSSEDANGRAFNVGSGTGTRLVDTAQMIIGLAGSGRIERVPWPALAEQIETGDFVADISRAQSVLGWRPQMPLGDGLRHTIAHYRGDARR